MLTLIEYSYIFITFSVLGWILEVFYRRALGGKWVNPGFLGGPFLPLYGTGVVILYFVSSLDIALWIKLIIFTVSTTGIEYLTGLFFLKYYKVRLWDYRHVKFNIQGLITPLYSFFWLLLSIAFYYLVYPAVKGNVGDIFRNLEYSMFVGMVLGIMLIDAINSHHIVMKIRRRIKKLRKSKAFVVFEELKLEVRRELNKHKGFMSVIFLPFKGVKSIVDHIGESIHDK